MPSFHLHEDRLKCPYSGCRKSFEKPAVLTDPSTMPRKSYYACPHCQSKIDILTENLKVVDVRPVEYPKVLDSPAKCVHHPSFLNTFPKDGRIPEECLVCPKILQCTARRQ
jgi:hypothetical protein